MTPTPPLDLLIIGAGPAGLSTAIEAQAAGLRYLVLDKGSVVESIACFQRNMFFFSTPELLEIGNVPFVIPTVRPTSLDCVNYYRSVCDHYKLACRFHTQVTGMRKGEGVFIATTATGEELTARAVVVATGYYDAPSPLNVPGEDLPHVSHHYRDPLPHYRQQVTIVGGKNSAIEAALDLWRHGAKVTLLHRGPGVSTGVKYWILPDFENRVKEGAITAVFNANVTAFFPGCTRYKTSGGYAELATDAAYVLIGYRPDLDLLRRLGVTFDPESLAPAHNPETMETPTPGLFVAGGMVGGKFNNKIFIENGRQHGGKIVAALRSRRSA
jgi:thioredoxin reductase (NADPH)